MTPILNRILSGRALAVLLAAVLLTGCGTGSLLPGSTTSGRTTSMTRSVAFAATAQARATAAARPQVPTPTPTVQLAPTATPGSAPTVVAGSGLQAALVGNWRSVSANPNVQDVWIFRPDGRFAFTADGQLKQGGKYVVGDDNHIEIEYAKGVKRTFVVSLDGTRLILEDNDKTVRVELERQP